MRSVAATRTTRIAAKPIVRSPSSPSRPASGGGWDPPVAGSTVIGIDIEPSTGVPPGGDTAVIWIASVCSPTPTATKGWELTTANAPGGIGVETCVSPIGTGLAPGRLSTRLMVAVSAAVAPWFAIVMETVTMSPSRGQIGFVDALTTARIGGESGLVGFGYPAVPRVSTLVPPNRRADEVTNVARATADMTPAIAAHGCGDGGAPHARPTVRNDTAHHIDSRIRNECIHHDRCRFRFASFPSSNPVVSPRSLYTRRRFGRTWALNPRENSRCRTPSFMEETRIPGRSSAS